MAENPYSQFVKGTSNPYSQFVKAATPAVPEKSNTEKYFTDFTSKPKTERVMVQSDFTGNIPPPMELPEYLADDPIMVNIGSGLKRTLSGLTRMALPKSWEPDWVSRESRLEDQEMRKGLEGTPGSFFGQMVGETIPTLPVKAPATAVQLLGQAAARAPTAVRLLTRAATSKPTQSAVEGAVDAAATADVGQEGGAAGLGAGIGGGLSVLGKAGGRLTEGLVKKSQAAQDLEHLASQKGMEIFQPIAQAAGDQDLTTRLFKSGYRELLPLIPGTSGRLERQAAEVGRGVRKIAAGEATPVGYTLRADPAENASAAVRELRREFNRRYLDTVKSYAFNVPSDFRDQVVSRIKAAHPNIDDVTLNKVATLADEYMARFSSGKAVIDGENLLEVKNAIGRSWKGAEGVAKHPTEIAQKYIDEIIETELRHGSAAQNLADLARYQELSTPYASFGPLSKAAKAAKANMGNFSPSQLARSSPEGSTTLDLAQTAIAASKDSATGRTARWLGPGGKIGVAGAAAWLDPASAVATLAGGQILSTEMVQKAFMGDLAAQKTLENFLRNNPQAAEDLGRLLRNSITTQVGSEYGN